VLSRAALTSPNDGRGFIFFANGINSVSDHGRGNSDGYHGEDAPSKGSTQVFHRVTLNITYFAGAAPMSSLRFGARS
jgi:hypothetical protein